MGVRIKVALHLKSDFHIGTGSGRGRATDAVFLSDENGLPYISGSTIKGLASNAAKELVRLYEPHLGVYPDDDNFAPSAYREIFGGGHADGYSEDRVFFDDARLPKGATFSGVKRVRTGRNARDRLSGTAKRDHLFFFEDAPAAIFEARLTADGNLSPSALLLLLLSLRRIENLGGQRRRGKGQLECSIAVEDAGEFPSANGQTMNSLNGLVLPDATWHDRFVEFAKPILMGSVGAADRFKVPSTNLVAGQGSPANDCWLVYAVAESAIAMSYDQAVDNVIQSADFVSGTALRGAIAWYWLRRGLTDSHPVFVDAIAKERVSFGPLYPIHGEWSSPATMPIPTPASIYTCKRYPGPLSDSPLNHGFADRLRVSADQRCRIEDCGAALALCGGYLQLAGQSCQPLSLLHADVAMTVLQRNNVEHAQLFGIEAIPRGTWFAGYVWGPESLLQALLAPWIEQRGKPWETLRVGKVRTRGLGKLEVRCVPASTSAHSDYPKFLSSRSQLDIASNDTFFVTLYSDTIALDRWMRPVTCLDASELWRQIGGSGDVPFEINRGYAATRRVGGYLGAVGLPRTTDVALQAGSTWKLSWTICDVSERNSAAEMLYAAQSNAIGFRRAEGYGRIMLNCPVHTISDDTLQVEKFDVACDPVSRPHRKPEPRRTLRGAQWMLQRRDADPRTIPYRRLLMEISQEDHPAEAFEAALTQSRRDEGGKRESFSRFVNSQRQKLYPEGADSLEVLVQKPPNSPEVNAFVDRLVTVAEGR